MDRNGLILGISAVFVGITALMLLVGVVVNPFFLFVAVPFGASAYLLWYQASGQLADRIRRDAAAGNFRATDRSPGFDAGAFGGSNSRRRSRERARQARQNRRKAQATGRDQSTLSPSTARRILDVEPTADEADIKNAYRAKAKEYHPDTDSGDEEQFKKISRAYETLSE